MMPRAWTVGLAPLLAAALAGPLLAQPDREENPSHLSLPGLPAGGDLSSRLRDRLQQRLVQEQMTRETLEKMKKAVRDAGIDPKDLDGLEKNPTFQRPDVQDRLRRMFEDPKTAEKLKGLAKEASEENERDALARIFGRKDAVDKLQQQFRGLKDADPERFKEIVKNLPLPQPSDTPDARPPFRPGELPSVPPTPGEVPPVPSTRPESTRPDPGERPTATKKGTGPVEGSPATRPGDGPAATKKGAAPPFVNPGDRPPATRSDGALPGETPTVPPASKPEGNPLRDWPGSGPTPTTKPEPGSGMKLDPATTQKWLEKLTESFEKAPQKLKDAPSFKKMVDSFTKSAAENKGGGKEWGDFFTKLGQSWSGKSPSVPKAGGDWKWPSLKDPPAAAPSAPSLPSSPPVPALGAAALPAVGSVAGFVGLLALLGLAALVVVGVWVLYGRRVRDWLDRRRGVELDAVVDPEDVTTSAALVRAFERLTLDQCGERARPWNHRRIALRLGGEDPRRREAARALADLYAVARYAPRNELPPEQLADARRHLSLLTGVTPA